MAHPMLQRTVSISLAVTRGLMLRFDLGRVDKFRIPISPLIDSFPCF